MLAKPIERERGGRVGGEEREGKFSRDLARRDVCCYYIRVNASRYQN